MSNIEIYYYGLFCIFSLIILVFIFDTLIIQGAGKYGTVDEKILVRWPYIIIAGLILVLAAIPAIFMFLEAIFNGITDWMRRNRSLSAFIGFLLGLCLYQFWKGRSTRQS